MTDPFNRYTARAEGRDPAPPPAPPVETRPSTLKIEGITISSARLVALDKIARQTSAARAGLADALADLRAKRDDARSRASHLRGRIAADPRAAGGEAHLNDLDNEITLLTAQMTEIDGELRCAAEAAAIARANLQAALTFARDHGLHIPAGVSQEVRG